VWRFCAILCGSGWLDTGGSSDGEVRLEAGFPPRCQASLPDIRNNRRRKPLKEDLSFPLQRFLVLRSVWLETLLNWFDVLVHLEEILGVILALQLHQTIELCCPIGSPYTVFTVIGAEEVYIDPTRRERANGGP
jgi:hypothetical protein